MDSPYVFDEASVVKTLEARWKTSDSGLEVYHHDQELRVSTKLEEDGAFLFCLSSFDDGKSWKLMSPFGEVSPNKEELEVASIDPLWQSAQGICTHMEKDHSETFPDFLNSVGASSEQATEISMPWVESKGFFLSVRREQERNFVWIPFPQECHSPNDVRKTLIKMLREIRGE